MSCNDDAENSSKWICKRCTFENWPKSIKCSICLAPNQTTAKFIINENTFTNDDCLARLNSSNDLNEASSFNLLNSKKWNCCVCTYLNWPKSLKCVQCQALKQQATVNLTTVLNEESQLNCITTETTTTSSSNVISNKNELNTKLDNNHDKKDLIKKNNNLNATNNSLNNLNQVDKELGQELNRQQIKFNKNVKPSTSTAKRTETNCDLDSNNSSSTNSLNNTNNEVNENNKLIDNYQTTLSKWRCTACTYDNFPKSIKCIICSTPKSALNSHTSSAINSTNDLIHNNNNLINNNEAICSGVSKSITNNNIEDKNRNTPSPINGASCNQQRIRLSTATNNSLTTNVNAIINYNLNNRRKNRDFVDWNWLEACVGVIENGDPEPVLVYLNSGGDLARQLTLVEVNFLNKQTLVGYTLIHLAIRFKVCTFKYYYLIH